MKKLSAIFLLFSMFICSCTFPFTKKVDLKKKDGTTVTLEFNLEEKRKLDDLNYMCKELESNHGNMYRSVSKEKFEEEKNKLIEKIPNLNDTDFKYEISHLMTLLHDNNASCTIVPDDRDGEYIMPFRLNRYSDGFYITSSYDKKYLGCKVEAINDVSIDKIAEKMKYIISCENESAFNNKVVKYMHNAGLLKYMKIIDDDNNIKVTLIKDNNKQEANLKAVKTEMADLFKETSIDNSKMIVPISMGEKNYSSKMIDNNVYYIKYTRCMEDSELSIKQFVNNINSDYARKKFKKVIVDFRNNVDDHEDSIGESSVFVPVIKEIQQLSKKGVKVYEIIGRGTIGVCIQNCLQLKRYANCTIVGEPTGTSVNPFISTGFTMNMKNSKTEFSFSNIYVENDKSDKRDSIYPEHKIDYSFTESMKGNDAAIQWVINN